MKNYTKSLASLYIVPKQVYTFKGEPKLLMLF